MQKTFYDLLHLLVERGRVPLDEWKPRASPAILNNDPFFRLVSVNEHEAMFDYDRLCDLSPEDMYDWHYQVVRGVRERRHSNRGNARGTGGSSTPG